MEPHNSEEAGHARPIDELFEQSRRLREQSSILAKRVEALNEQIDQVKNNSHLERLEADASKAKIDEIDVFAYESPDSGQ